MTKYSTVENILIDNGIPFKSVDLVGNGAPKRLRLEVFECGILLNEKEQIIKNLLAGENVKVYSSNEIVNIEIQKTT